MAGLQNRLANGFGRLINVIIGEAQKVDTERFDLGLSRGIIILKNFDIVRIAVEFNGELEFGAIEIENKLMDTVLAVKFVTVELFGAELLPEHGFSGRHPVP